MIKKIGMLITVLLFTILSCGGVKSGENTGKTKELTFLIWDRGQEPGMSAIAREFE